ncbi:hypothetical protein [Anaerobaca lacustris]|uniref:Alginate lyase domain-containing protein n=1 Tax=Anaerobaca lacustris TaxID=3044600 RepID=A0AAW6TYZ0_9BACT|nr:hypothetical protein [Sedimentisphaerales bacterium M17dextr]
MKRTITAILLAGTFMAIPAAGAQAPEGARSADLGAYSREATEAARARLDDTLVVVFAGGRHGFIQGRQVSLDPEAWQTEAQVVKGKVMVPKRFALSAFGIKRLPWFGFRIAERGKMVAISDLAARLGKKVFTEERGLVIVSDTPMTLGDSQLIDSIITLFDTPEKFADPQIAYRNIPSLKAWGRWTEHAKFTPKQLALYDGPQTQWRLISEKRYSEPALGMHELASDVPPPGVHPRILFGPQDISLILARIKSSVTGAMSLIETEHLLGQSWLDPDTDDGRLFARLVDGDLEGLAIDELTSPDREGTDGRVNRLTRSLNTIALYALLTENNDLGTKAAAAIANYYRRIEPAIDAHMDRLDVYNAYWRDVPEWVGPMDLGLNYDFAARWMTPEQKTQVRRLIAKLVSGRRGYGQNGPLRVRDNHCVTRGLTIFLANLALEGEDGFDREVHDAGIETVKAFLQWGIDEYGTLYESNGAGGAGLPFQLLSMVALARRGVNTFGHPHWQRLMESQVQCTSPDGTVTASRGAWGSEALHRQIIAAWKILYPSDRTADYLLGPAHSVADFDPQQYRRRIASLDTKHMPLPGLTDPGAAKSLLYDAPWRSTSREALGLPLDFSNPSQGLFSSRSDSSKDALWVNMQARPDLYLGSGSMHHDAGSFYLQSHGVTWGRDGLSDDDPASKDHSIVLIDGVGQDVPIPADTGTASRLAPPRAKYLGAATTDLGAIASADLRYAYDWLWTTQVADWAAEPIAGRTWELETDSLVVQVFKGTQRYRINYGAPPLHSRWFPTLRAPCNPVMYAYRSVGLLRGNHPYAVVLDDIRKDDQTHLYEWQMAGSFRVMLPGLDAEALVLTAAEGSAVPEGTPMLLVQEVGPSTCRLENVRGRTLASAETVECRFRIVLVPFRMGEDLPAISVDASTGTARLEWADQQDELQFEVAKDNRTRLRVLRDGEEILRSR